MSGRAKGVTGFFMAWGSFLAIPCPRKIWDEGARKQMLRALPAIGLIIGLIWYALLRVLLLVRCPAPLEAAAMTAYPLIVTGAIHFDGFMDVNDAVLSRRPLEERRKILKDSRVGAFAVIAAATELIVFYGACLSRAETGFSAQSSFMTGAALIAVPVMARLAASAAVLGSRPMETSQYAGEIGNAKNRCAAKFALCLIVSVAVCMAVCAAILSIVNGSAAAVIRGAVPAGDAAIFWIRMAAGFAVPYLASMLAILYARRDLDGMNGDIAGYGVVYGELAGVIALAFI
jgi:adenosylcobinamide-GDP ribazoletransferase